MKNFLKIILSLILILIIKTNYSFGQDSLKKTDSKSDSGSFIALEGTYIRHLGNFGSIWSHTTGIYATYGVYYPSNYILNLKIGYLTVHNKKDSNFPPNSGATIVPVIIGGKYLFNFGIVKPYLSFNNGVNIIFQKVDFNGERDEKTMQKYYWQAGTGMLIDINKKLKIDLSVNVNSHFYQDDAMMTGFEYMIGLQY